MRASRATRSAAILIVAGILLTACAGEPEASPSPSPSASSTPSAAPVEPAAPVTAPLTGAVLEAPIQLPAISAKIDNHPDARPQYGLESTDLVYEELVEGGLTRYVAVWHSSVPQQIGPVRSIRPMDPAIASPFGGMIAFSGGQEIFVAAMQATNVANVVHGAGTYDGYYSRGGAHAAPHNVLLQAAQLQQDNAAIAPPQSQFAYASDEAAPSSQAGGPAAQLSLAFSPSQSRQWGCDPATGRWQRGQQGVADVDANGTQLSAANVVVLRVQIRPNNGVPQTMLEGNRGDGFVASGCTWIPVTWIKPDVASPIQVLDASGQPVVLAQGNSWIELVPAEGSATVS